MKAPLKWVGGKTQIIQTILDCLPLVMNDYYEPFVGGGSVLLGVLRRKAQGAIRINGDVYANDLNPDLMNFWRVLQSDVEGLIAALQEYENQYVRAHAVAMNGRRNPSTLEEALTSAESLYYWYRARYNAGGLAPLDSAALFGFLNKTGFRGLYRRGPHGLNTPFGHYASPAICPTADLREASGLLAGVVFSCEDYNGLLDRCKTGDGMYLDPPYVPVKTTSFTEYMEDGFPDQAGFLEHVGSLATRGIRFVLSNSACPLVIAAFPETTYNVRRISCRRAIHCTAPDSRATEVIITAHAV
jgi:DNA adenine methylase